MKNIKNLLSQFDQVKTISKSDSKELKGGGYGFLYRGGGTCRFCGDDDDDA